MYFTGRMLGLSIPTAALDRWKDAGILPGIRRFYTHKTAWSCDPAAWLAFPDVFAAGAGDSVGGIFLRHRLLTNRTILLPHLELPLRNGSIRCNASIRQCATPVTEAGRFSSAIMAWSSSRSCRATRMASAFP